MTRNEKGQFTPETHKSLTAEEKVRISRRMSEAWKDRDDYIGDIKEKSARVFNSWRAIRFTEKGKKAGCCEEWKDYRTFFNDVFPSYIPGLVLRRKDIYKPWSPQNFMWVRAEEAGAVRAKVVIEYNGEALTIVQWGERLSIPYNQIKQRYYKHKNDFSSEEILFGRKKKRGSKKAKDITDKNVNIRAKASKMISSYRNKDIKNGTNICDIDIDWMIGNILKQPCFYCGDTNRVGCDRIDNNKGHTKDNVVPCCIECNTARNNYFTYEEMRHLGKAIAEIKAAREK